LAMAGQESHRFTLVLYTVDRSPAITSMQQEARDLRIGVAMTGLGCALILLYESVEVTERSQV
jgi:hypothetical protein